MCVSSFGFARPPKITPVPMNVHVVVDQTDVTGKHARSRLMNSIAKLPLCAGAGGLDGRSPRGEGFCLAAETVLHNFYAFRQKNDGGKKWILLTG